MDKRLVGNEPPYVKLYIKDMLYLCGLPPRQYQVMLYLLKCATYANDGKMQILIPTGLKKMMMEELGIKAKQSINNTISRLCKAGIIHRIATSVYRLNPYLFGRGEWKDICEIRMSVTYNLQGRKINTAVQHNKNARKDAISEETLKELEKGWEQPNSEDCDEPTAQTA